MIKKIIFVSLFLFILTSCNSNEIIRIKFGTPANGIELKNKITFSNKLVGSEKLEDVKKFPSYKFNFNKKSEKVNKIKTIMSIKSEKAVFTGSYNQYKDNGHNLKVYNNSNFIWQKDNWADSGIASMSDDEAKRIVNDFMANNDLIPEGFYLNDKVKYSGIGNTVTVKIVEYNRKINNIEVIGMSRISIGVNDSGIVSYQSAYSDYLEKKETEIISLETAKNMALKCEGVFEYDMNEIPGEVANIEINEVELLYHEDSTPNSKQNYIQPCYRFKGKVVDKEGRTADYFNIIRAIPDNLTVE